MKHLFLFTLIFWTTNIFGQTLEKGIYIGQKLPFTICYLTCTDSAIEVEYFFQKGGQIFGHIPTKRLEIATEYSVTKAAFKSQDDSITVFAKTNYFLINRKGSAGIKVYKSADTNSTITTLRNRNALFVFSQNLYSKYKALPDFDQEKFWNKLHSYELDKFVSLDNKSFNAKLEEALTNFKKD